MSIPFTELPDDARVWVYGADRRLTADETTALRGDLIRFLDQWTAHGAQLRAAVDIMEQRFIAIAADEASASASGCSIDAMGRYLAQIERGLSVSLLDGTRVFYRSADGEVTACDRPTFRQRVRDGRITESTRVFDLTIGTLAELREGRLERALADSWHRKLVAEVLETT